MWQWHNIVFCLSLLLFKLECSVKKFIEGLSFYCNKLHKEGIYAHFQEILVKVWDGTSDNIDPTPPLNLI